jgi:hypothetical protein
MLFGFWLIRPERVVEHTLGGAVPNCEMNKVIYYDEVGGAHGSELFSQACMRAY